MLTHAEHLDLRLRSFERWLTHQPSILDGTRIDLITFEATELPDPNAERKALARERREVGALLSEIASEFDISLSTASSWCEGITPVNSKRAELKTEAYKLHHQENLSYREIGKRLGKSPNTIKGWIQKM